MVELIKRQSQWLPRSRQIRDLYKSLDEGLTRDPAHGSQSNARVGRESNPLNLSVFTDVLQAGSQVMYQTKTIDEVMCQRIYGVLPLNYGAYDLHLSRAGGNRTHNFRLLRHVLQLGSQSLSPVVSLSQRKERESNPQGLSCKLGRLPTGSRRHSVCPSVRCSSSSTRNRTWNFSLEARDDVRFTTEPWQAVRCKQ